MHGNVLLSFCISCYPFTPHDHDFFSIKFPSNLREKKDKSRQEGKENLKSAQESCFYNLL